MSCMCDDIDRNMLCCVSVAMAAALSRLAMVSNSKVEVGMEAVAVSLEDMGAVEGRAVDLGEVEANTSPLSLEEGLTAHLLTTALLHHKAMGNKVSTDREVGFVHHIED